MFATKVETPRYRFRTEMEKMVYDLGSQMIGSGGHAKSGHN